MKKNAVCIFFTEVRDLNLVWRRSRIITSSYSSNKTRLYGFKITISTLQKFCLVVWVLLFGDHSGEMSKLSFRARALDATKPMPIFRSEEIPDLPDFAAINRAVPQMPTGMEKEEECEHHLQRAISAQQAFGHTGELVIPTPEVYTIPEEEYELIYPGTYKATRQLIHMQPFAMDHDKPDYDMDSEDEKWINLQARKMEITQIQFEEVMDRLEKSSGQQVVTLKEAKLLLKQDDDLIIAVYDYWLNKRLKTQHPLIPTVKTEKRDGSTNNNPYVAFRRRIEKMQTRKNRKNDEASYEKMLKVRRDLSRAVTLLEMVKRREKTKREHLHLTIEVFEKRFQAGDFSGQILAEVAALKHTRTNFISVNNSCSQGLKQEGRVSKHKPFLQEASAPRKKREYTKRKTKQEVVQPAVSQRVETDTGLSDLLSSDDEALSQATSPSEPEDEPDPDGVFAFRRKKFCNYQAAHPLGSVQGNWAWCSPEEGGAGDRRFRYCLTSLRLPKPTCIGFARRRIGRGGRILLDRTWTPLDDYWTDLDHFLNHSLPNGLPPSNEFLAEIKNEWTHFRPQTPPPDECSVGDDLLSADEINEDGVPTVDLSLVGIGSDQGDIEPYLTTTAELLSQLEASNSVFNLQSYQSHQEELFEMQRKQLERLKEEESQLQKGLCRIAEHSFASQPTSRFTLDSASVQFAVSAVLSTSQVSGFVNKPAVPEPANHHSISTSSTTTTSNTSTTTTSTIKLERTLGLTNGPTATACAVASTAAPVDTHVAGVVKSEASLVASQAPSIVISSDSVLEMALSDRVQGTPTVCPGHVHMAPSTETSEPLPDFITFKGVPHELRLTGIERNNSDKQSSSQVNFSLTSVKLEPVSTDCGFPMDVT